ncbi:AaceriAAR154Wp [[Ashbya] aceris (nom. inval.)]|nr:AaceriAAR154Wp [[Ashbya] aceris (nom. inval.)]
MREKQQSTAGAGGMSSGAAAASPGQRHASIVEMLSTPPPAIVVQTGMEDENLRATGGETTADGDERRTLSRQSSTSSTESHVSATSCLSKVHTQKWQHIELSQLVEENKLVFINAEISVEEAFNTLVEHNLTSLPVEQYPGDMDCVTFDYNDLNSYLLLVLGKTTVADEEITRQCQLGQPVPVGRIVKLTPKNPFYKVPETENLSTVMGILGSGVHRVAIMDSTSSSIRGILSQRRLMKYLWDNARQFSNLEVLLNSSLQKLGIGVLDPHTLPTSRQSRVISILDTEPLLVALHKMHTERISSIAVIDHQGMLLGNISVTDVKQVTRTSQYPLLHNTCRHFISVILNNRGLEMGKDSFPIFHVYPTSSLARTVAKLVATKAHRLWIVQPVEQGILVQPPVAPTTIDGSPDLGARHVSPPPAPPPAASHGALGASGSPLGTFDKEYSTGKLIGVVSLTDILGLLARKHTENKLVDPLSARRQRGSVAR